MLPARPRARGTPRGAAPREQGGVQAMRVRAIGRAALERSAVRRHTLLHRVCSSRAQGQPVSFRPSSAPA